MNALARACAAASPGLPRVAQPARPVGLGRQQAPRIQALGRGGRSRCRASGPAGAGRGTPWPGGARERGEDAVGAAGLGPDRAEVQQGRGAVQMQLTPSGRASRTARSCARAQGSAIWPACTAEAPVSLHEPLRGSGRACPAAAPGLPRAWQIGPQRLKTAMQPPAMRAAHGPLAGGLVVENIDGEDSRPDAAAASSAGLSARRRSCRNQTIEPFHSPQCVVARSRRQCSRLSDRLQRGGLAQGESEQPLLAEQECPGAAGE